MYKVSVIIPVYNVEKQIERCIRSLFEQTLDDIEYIFVDDASPDDSISIIKTVLLEYPNRHNSVRFVTHEKNRGLSAARNSGLEVATGEYIAHCDSDDWVDCNMYNILYEEAMTNRSELVYSDLYLVFKDSMVKYESVKYTSDKVDLLCGYIGSQWTSLVNMLVHKSIYKNNKLKSPEHICYCEDFWLSVRLFYYAQRITKVNEGFYFYDQTNVTSILHNVKKWRGDDLKCYLETIDFFTKEGCIELYKKEMSWRVLNAFHFDMFKPQKHKEILEIYPACHKFILSNPFYTKRQKQLMWMLTHHCRWVVLLFIYFRKFLGRKDIV